MAGIRCQLTDDIESIRAKKLILNSVLNPLSALEQKNMAELIEDSSLRSLGKHIIQEAWSVLHSKYWLPSPEVLLDEIYQTARQVPDHYSSTYQDVISGRPSEIDFLNGYIVKLGAQNGIPTPYNREITQRIRILEEKLDEGKLDEEKTA